MSEIPNLIVNEEFNIASQKDPWFPKRKFSIYDDQQLCRSYLYVAFDADYSPEQKSSGSTFWSKIKEHYRENSIVGSVERHSRALPARWHIISKAVNKYAEIVKQVEKSNEDNPNIDKASDFFY
ncbi:hypothetical protein PHYBLDRAFT_66464 [Phycomyces blakesleeanus NRRL 1555(-)]|uniref:Uncharacterized protein n=1 Tax=Phycomyces blakesleeanus (strain ATCC 8743b / DSM 1359 / FGSC 10004 / NBRC 33097 / NRRL 1555) TaxID=763407 RepID=A0A167LWX1_PHYB8|nr:hypothetical protein PHYBLDRAFT_66464 [Phycomyces blakesleeanus NRRL 1555(-)]OAD71256.1 hypothetical protein PHYBLDRAFT_66464 [Phycomyces blakesleeanus NRRL 1555(-)]|eukprot:XP_018289296.1 hypothetical protein PHYBLDRAFT_66464 [Phycomyces blakesleeanus NRRL 1555(-)]